MCIQFQTSSRYLSMYVVIGTIFIYFFKSCDIQVGTRSVYYTELEQVGIDIDIYTAL